MTKPYAHRNLSKTADWYNPSTWAAPSSTSFWSGANPFQVQGEKNRVPNTWDMMPWNMVRNDVNGNLAKSKDMWEGSVDRLQDQVRRIGNAPHYLATLGDPVNPNNAPGTSNKKAPFPLQYPDDPILDWGAGLMGGGAALAGGAAAAPVIGAGITGLSSAVAPVAALPLVSFSGNTLSLGGAATMAGGAQLLGEAQQIANKYHQLAATESKYKQQLMAQGYPATQAADYAYQMHRGLANNALGYSLRQVPADYLYGKENPGYIQSKIPLNVLPPLDTTYDKAMAGRQLFQSAVHPALIPAYMGLNAATNAVNSVDSIQEDLNTLIKNPQQVLNTLIKNPQQVLSQSVSANSPYSISNNDNFRLASFLQSNISPEAQAAFAKYTYNRLLAATLKPLPAKNTPIR